MPAELRLVSANIASALHRHEAAEALRLSLAQSPDVIGLQEWTLKRRGLLRMSTHAWFAPSIGGCAIGWRSDRFSLVRKGIRFLSPPARTDAGDRLVPLLPARSASIVTLREDSSGSEFSILNYHLVAGVQASGVYREDRPVLSGRHRSEAKRLQRLSERVDFAMGDSNFDGFTLPGLTSAWTGHEDLPGTFGRRHIDDVFGRGAALDVQLITTPSDHKALSVRRPFPA